MTGVPIYPCELLGCPPCVWHCEAMYYQPYPYWYQEPPPGLYNCGEPPAGAPTHRHRRTHPHALALA